MSLEKQFKEDMDLIADALSKNINGIRTVTFNTVKGQMSRRIFQQGQSTDGSPIGQYATSTKKFRNEVGRRIDKVDLELTGTLRQSLIVGTEGKQVTMGFTEATEPEVQAVSKIKETIPKIKNLGSLLVATSSASVEKRQRQLRAKRKAKSGGVNTKSLVIVGKTDFSVTENAIAQEKRFGKDIFAPTKEEIETGEEVFLFEVDKLIKKTLGKTKTVRVKRK